MTSKLRQFLVIILASAAVAACQDAPTEVATDDVRFASERIAEESVYDYTGSFTSFPCDENGDPLELGEGELIALEGQVYERSMLVRSAVDDYHFTVHTMPVGFRGVGVTSGENFRVDEREQLVVNQRAHANNGAYHSTLKIVGETGRTFWLRYTYNYRLDSDGALHRERTDSSFVCKA